MDLGLYFVYALKLEGFVVYVGCTSDPWRRFSEHKGLGREFDILEILATTENALVAQTLEKRLQLHYGVADNTTFADFRRRLQNAKANRLKKNFTRKTPRYIVPSLYIDGAHLDGSPHTATDGYTRCPSCP